LLDLLSLADDLIDDADGTGIGDLNQPSLFDITWQWPVANISTKISLAIFPEIVPSSISLISDPRSWGETRASSMPMLAAVNSRNSSERIQLAAARGLPELFTADS
jgi:hypothetical protein